MRVLAVLNLDQRAGERHRVGDKRLRIVWIEMQQRIKPVASQFRIAMRSTSRLKGLSTTTESAPNFLRR